MTSLSRGDSESFRLSVGICVWLVFVSGISELWFARSYYSNSGRVGWGDPSADGAQSFFWWGTVVSGALLLLSVTVTAIRSERFRFAVAGGGLIAGVLLLMRVSRWPEPRYEAVPLMPGMFATAMAFGIHADFRKWTALLWLFEINAVFYAAMTGGVLALLSRRRRMPKQAKS